MAIEPPEVTGGDGTTGILQGHCSGEHPSGRSGDFLGPNGWRVLETIADNPNPKRDDPREFAVPGVARSERLSLVNTPAHPNPR